MNPTCSKKILKIDLLPVAQRLFMEELKAILCVGLKVTGSGRHCS